MEAFGKFSALWLRVANFPTAILIRGDIPEKPLDVFVVPVLSESERAISLIDSRAKILGVVVLFRLPPSIEPTPKSVQFARRKASGAGMRMAEFYDCVRTRN